MSKNRRYNYFDDDMDNSTTTSSGSKNSKSKHENISNAVKNIAQKEEQAIKSLASSIASHDDDEEISKSKRFTRVLSLAIITILIFAIIIGATTFQMNKANKRDNKFETDAGTTCATLQSRYGLANFESLVNSEKINGFRMTGLCFVRRVDFNGDKTNELLACYNQNGVFYYEVWGYNSKNEFTNLFKGEAPISASKNSWITLYKKDDKYYIGEHKKDDITVVNLYGMKGDTFTKKYRAAFDTHEKVFSIKGKKDEEHFERVMLAVLQRGQAQRMVDRTTDTIDGFDDSEANKSGAVGKDINAAYYDIIANYNKRYGYAEYKEKGGKAYIDGLAIVDLIDFDGDGTKELIVVYNKGIKVRTTDKKGNYLAKLKYKYYIEIYKYNGNGAVRVYENEGLSGKKNNSKDIYYMVKYDDGKYYLCTNTFSSGEYGNEESATSSILKLKKNTFKTDYKAHYSTDYGYTEYYINGEQVYRSTFSVKGYKVPFFDGSEKYDSDVYKVTYVQRKTSDSSSVENQVAKTENTIKQLNSAYQPEENEE